MCFGLVGWLMLGLGGFVMLCDLRLCVKLFNSGCVWVLRVCAFVVFGFMAACGLLLISLLWWLFALQVDVVCGLFG